MSKSSGKIVNEYVESIPQSLYDNTPKAVWAAIAISFIFNYLEQPPNEWPAQVVKEWTALHENGIVPQKPITLDAVQKIEERYETAMRDYEEQRRAFEAAKAVQA